MKKLSLLGLALMLVMGAAFAAPVGVNQAKSLGLKYVQQTLGAKSADLSLVYTETCTSGVEALYVFNYDNGYVVVAADDRAYPILGYCTDAQFDVNNIPEGLRYYLGHYARQIQYAIDENLAVEPEVAEQWYLLDKEGVTMKTRSNRAVAPLLATTWDQDSPYNYYCPQAAGGPGGRAYAGCVATAMSQVMKYWNWPETGNGQHSYSTSSYGGTLSANFGATTYNWSIMPNSCSANNAASQAVALLMYHCGIAVDMDYAPNGSGAHAEDVPDAVINYFRYGSCTNVKYRDQYTKTQWEDMLIASFDRGIPVVYAGSDNGGGHAFNCDGYNDQRKFHFNWGWSGMGNNQYYEIDALNTFNGSFNDYQRVVLEMVPDYVYDAMVPPIESLEATVNDASTHTVVLSLTVPENATSGAQLESIASIVILRNDVVVKTYDAPQPGEQLSFEDNVDDDGCYIYSIYGVNNNIRGELYKTVVVVGPNCTWKLIGQTTNFQGWNGGKLQFVDHKGVIFKEITMSNSSPISEKFQMPEGEISLKWVAPTTTVESLTINLKNSANQSVYSHTGSSNQLNGTIFTGTNDCPNCTPPTDLVGEYSFEGGVFGTRLTWNCDYDPSKYKIYRSDDGVEYTEIAAVENTQKEYFDEAGAGSFYYKVTAFSTACESTPAFTAEGTDYVFVTVTAVDEHEAEATIYPNPARESLSIQAAGIQQVVLYNVVGQQVYRFQGSTDALTVNTSQLESGIYTVSVTTSTGKTSHRIVVMH